MRKNLHFILNAYSLPHRDLSGKQPPEQGWGVSDSRLFVNLITTHIPFLVTLCVPPRGDGGAAHMVTLYKHSRAVTH